MYLIITVYNMAGDKVSSVSFYDTTVTSQSWVNYFLDELRTGRIQGFTITKEGY